MNGEKIALGDIISSVTQGAASVSRETIDKLVRFLDLLHRWNETHNLISASSYDDVWRRHVADSAQILPIVPGARRWLDLGSGAGFPGLVLAILLAEKEGAKVDMIESSHKRATFLRTVIRETGVPAEVHSDRIEKLVPSWGGGVEVVTARAVAPLTRLFEWSFPIIEKGAVGVFHKGRDFEVEHEISTKYWKSDLVKIRSVTDPDSCIVRVDKLNPRISRTCS